MTFAQWLEKRNACAPAIEWVGTQSFREAWAQCPRGDWLIWLAFVAGVDRRICVHATGHCVRVGGQPHPAYDEAFDALEDWCTEQIPVRLLRAAFRKATSTAEDNDAAFALLLAMSSALIADRRGAATKAGDAMICAARPSQRTLEGFADLVRANIPIEMIERAPGATWRR